MNVTLDASSISSYNTFLQIKQLPRYSVRGRVATFPSEYADRIGMKPQKRKRIAYEPNPLAYDYQRAITSFAIDKGKYAIFADPGRGKTLMFLDYARHWLRLLPKSQCVLIVSPLMVIDQTISEAERFYNGDLPIEKIPAANLQSWLHGDRVQRLGICNYEAFREDLSTGDLGAIIGDETSLLKSMYGKYGSGLISLGRGLEGKLANTGTPAPNDRIEYGNHAIWLDQFPTLNSFLAKYFVNRGQTGERWEMKPHALEPFYRTLSHWAFFLNSPASYGWHDQAEPLPPIHIHYHPVDLTEEQATLTMAQSGQLIPVNPGGIAKRSSWGQISKGYWKNKKIRTNKPAEILRLVDSWPDESTIIWCIYDKEQEIMEELFPDALSIKGTTPIPNRMEMIADFQAGRNRVMISKARVLGFGLNLQVATRHIFSGLQDSYELFYQAVKRSNRIGSTRPLNVHIPLTCLEEPMVENVMRKAKMIQTDSEAQEEIFKRVIGKIA